MGNTLTTATDGELCRKCGLEALAKGHPRWCRGCLNDYQRLRRAKLSPSNAEAVIQGPDELAAAEQASGGVWHCDRCQRVREPFEAPLDSRGHRILGTDPIGWAPGHGPESGKLCCKHRTCFDARPGHRVWPVFPA
jgi:hypothetical protein